ncbi:MAG TPA: RNB domain-containing ribonuclease [Solirubrobacterales bacterium]|nr:RNB domain-containing ribonuclease [Solirubrobacterales bacterium]
MISKRGRFLVGEPLFERGGRISIEGGARVGPGRMALVEMRPGRARVLEDLGRPDRAADVIAALLLERDLPTGFPSKVDGEAAEVAKRPPGDRGGRRDLTELPTLTVDPATARDFDDAVSASETDGGVRLWIHIADVAAHVRPDSHIDREAKRRANSTYVPGTVVPMLPFALSSGACSLSPGDERLAVTTEIEVGDDGDVRSTRFYRSRIRSDARLNYDQLDEIFSGRAEAPAHVAEELRLTRRVASVLAERRAGQAIEVSSAEPEFVFEGGDVTGAREIVQTESHRLIEQLMILNNERVAELLERKGIPTLYRVHEQPDPERVAVLFSQLDALDIPTPPLPENLAPTQAGQLAIEASLLVAEEARRRGHGREAYTSLVLRSLNQAHYSDHNVGHAGLGSPAYCHFTSPIRRYPDLVAHRALLSAVGAGERPARAEEVGETGIWCSERERDSARLEREADDVCGAFLLEKELFERGHDADFEGEVSGVVGAGAFVRFGGALADVYEGFLPARVIGGRERYELDETETMLVGQRDGGRVRVGDPVRVEVERVEAPRGRVDLVLARTGDRRR